MSFRIPKPLYYASLEGLGYVKAVLIHRGADINAQGGMQGNALQAASARAHEVAAMLLEKTAELCI